jgi:leader peptidase (prepilin peptidase) / N-methyltransferase
MVALFSFIFGLLFGSFANVLADRLPKGQDVLWGRSHCDYCRKQLRWFELIPLFSYMYLGGRCSRCHKKLSFQYPLVEFICGLGFAGLSYIAPTPLSLIFLCLVFVSFLVMFVADLKYQILPDSMVILSFVSSVGWLVATDGLEAVMANATSALVTGAFFYMLWKMTRGRGMGFGDVKLSISLGLLLGFPAIIFGLYIAFLTGAIVGVILMIVGRKTLKSKIAFGPFLLLGSMAAFIWADQLLGWWNNLV